jgi:hypothetical protein
MFLHEGTQCDQSCPFNRTHFLPNIFRDFEWNILGGSLLYNGYRVFPGGKERPGRDADPSPPSSAVVMRGQSYTSTPPMGRTACTEPQCLYKGALYLYLILYIVSLLLFVVSNKNKSNSGVRNVNTRQKYNFHQSSLKFVTVSKTRLLSWHGSVLTYSHTVPKMLVITLNNLNQP